jgi:hypothetical protein
MTMYSIVSKYKRPPRFPPTALCSDLCSLSAVAPIFVTDDDAEDGE